MSDEVNTENFELFRIGMPVRNLSEVIQTGLFKGSTVDLFYIGQHLRIEEVTFFVDGSNIRVDTRYVCSPIRRFRKGRWKTLGSRSLSLYLSGQSIPVAYHDADGMLMFITMAHTTHEGKPAQFVLYCSGRKPKPEDLQIVDWPEGLLPEFGGAPMR